MKSVLAGLVFLLVGCGGPNDGNGNNNGNGNGSDASSGPGDGAPGQETGACTGECKPGAMDTRACPWGAPATRACTDTCTWGALSACVVPQGWRAGADGPAARNNPRAVFTGTEMIVWGSGLPGGAYDPSKNTWRTIASPPAAVNATGDVAWTGTQMIVLVGTKLAFYDPAADSWTTGPDAPLQGGTGRTNNAVAYDAKANLLMAWGGYNGSFCCIGQYGDGAVFNVSTKQWKPMKASPLGARSFSKKLSFAAVSNGKLVVWGGGGYGGGTQDWFDGATYDPSADAWAKLPAPPMGSLRSFTNGLSASLGPGVYALFFGGDQYGGVNANYPTNSGAYWDDAKGQWTAVGAPMGSGEFLNGQWAVAGLSLYAFGGVHYTGMGGNPFPAHDELARYDQAQGTWTSLAPSGTPRVAGAAVFSGQDFIVWGGSTTSGPTSSTILYRP